METLEPVVNLVQLLDTVGVLGVLVYVTYSQAAILRHQRECHQRQYESLLKWVMEICQEKVSED